MVRKLKLHFNKQFDELRQVKDGMLNDIQGWLKELHKVETHLGGGNRDNDAKAYDSLSFQWSALENPALDLPHASRKKEVVYS